MSGKFEGEYEIIGSEGIDASKIVKDTIDEELNGKSSEDKPIEELDEVIDEGNL